MLIGYARTSTADQEAGFEAQLRDLEAAGCNKIFSEKVSSVSEDRPELDRAIGYLRDGDTLVVTKLDRLVRSVTMLWKIVDRIQSIEGGASLRILNFGGESIDTRGATGRLLLSVFAAFAQFEREIMLERQRESILKAQREGRRWGRKPSKERGRAVEMILAGASPGDVVKELGIGRATVMRALADYRKNSDVTVTNE